MKFIILFLLFYSSVFKLVASPTERNPSELKSLADNYLKENRYDSASVYYGKAAKGFFGISEIKSFLYCKNQEALSMGIQYQNKEGLAIAEQIVKEYPDSLKAFKYDVYFYWKLALFNFRLGKYSQAYSSAITTKEVAESYGIFQDYMKNEILDILTTSARYLGLYDAGLNYAFEKLNFNLRNSDFLNLSHTYNSMGLIYKRFHDNKRALEYFTKSLDLRNKYAPEWAPYIMTNIGEMYLENDNPDSALYWYSSALQNLSDRAVPENLLYSVLYAGISNIVADKGDFIAALNYMNKCMDIRSDFFQPGDNHYDNFLKQKAEILIKAGELNSALEILDQIKQNFIEDSNSPQRISSYYLSMAYYFKAAGNIQRALKEQQESVIALSKDFSNRDIFSLPDINTFFYGKEKLLYQIIQKTSLLNDLYMETGEQKVLQSIIDHYNFALKLIAKMIDDQSSLNSISALFKDYRILYETAIKASIALHTMEPGNKNYMDISSFMEASRMNHAKILFRLNQVINYGGIPDSVIQQKNELEKQILSVRKDSLKDPGSFSDIFNLEQELDRINFLVKNENRKMDLLKNSDFNLLEKCQKELGKDRMLLQYYFGENNLYLLKSTKQENQLFTLPWSENERNDLKEFLRLLRKPGYDISMKEINQRVFHSLGLDAVLDNEFNEITIIPDRELYFVPFEALKDQNGKYLIYDYTIYFENSLFFLNQPFRLQKKSVQFLGLAPFTAEFDGSPSTDSIIRIQGEMLKPLPGTKRELESIKKLMGGIIMTGNSATESFFRENADKSKIIHLSSHSYLDDSDPLYNRIVFAPGKGIHDGNLYTHELYGLNLNCEMVTLSACNTGVGKYMDGEGMISLATGFRSSGVKNIVMSLWSLPDDATSELMTTFYTYLKKGENKAEALRLAKIDYLEKSDQNASVPYFWAATVLTGDNKPLGLENNFLKVLVFSLAIILLIIITIFYLKKSKFMKTTRN